MISADPDRDRAAIVSVWERNLPRPSHCSHDRRYEWQYLKSPVGPGLCWLLLAQPGDRVVGTAGLALRAVKLGTRQAIAGIAADFAVDPEHRSLLPALMLQKAVLGSRNRGVNLIYGLPNAQAAVVFKRLGYSTIGGLRRYTRRLRTDEYLHQFTRFPYVGRALAARMANGVLALVSPETYYRPRCGRLQELPGFDLRFDDLWSRVSGRFATIGERNSPFLHWRYSQCPLQEHTVLGLVTDDSSRLVGYVVAQRNNYRWLIVDLLVDETPDSCLALLAGFLNYAGQRGAQSVTLDFHSPAAGIEAALRHLRFRRRDSATSMTICAECPGERFPPEEVTQWHFLRGDID